MRQSGLEIAWQGFSQAGITGNYPRCCRSERCRPAIMAGYRPGSILRSAFTCWSRRTTRWLMANHDQARADSRRSAARVVRRVPAKGRLLVWSCTAQAKHLGDYLTKRPGGLDLVIGYLAQPRLDQPQIIKDTLQLAG